MACSSAAPKFTVQRRPEVLVAPAAPTPHELKRLSDFDDQDSLRFQVPAIQFYRRNESMGGKDPVQVIRDALAKALVPYYPFAGRGSESTMDGSSLSTTPVRPALMLALSTLVIPYCRPSRASRS